MANNGNEQITAKPARETGKRCGTCVYWTDKQPSGDSLSGLCDWSKGNLPAYLRAAPEMWQDQGTDCAMWRGWDTDDD